MKLKTLLQAGAAAATAATLLMPTAATSQQAKGKAKSWKDVEAEKAKAASDAAAASKAAADARKSEADAAVKAAEIAARSKREEAAAAAAKDEADRAWAADPKNPDNVAREAAKAKAESQTKQGYIMPAVTLGVAVVGGVIGAKLGGRFGASAARAVKESVGKLEGLGRDAAKINKAAGVIAGTVKGDAMKAITDAAAATARAAQATPAAIKAGNALNAVTFGQGVAMGVGSTMVDDPALKSAMRIEAAASIGASVGLKGALAVAKGGLPKVPAAAMAKIDAGKFRLARETRDGAEAISKIRVAAESAKASGATGVAKVEATAAVDSAKRAARAAATAKGSGMITYQRTYKSGPKAGLTETVTRAR